MPTDTSPAPAAARWPEAAWFALVSLGTLVVAVPRYILQLGYGPGWDPYTFLLNALEFAGKGKAYMEIYRPPLLPFIVSLFMRMGVDQVWPLFFVDLVVTVIGVLGLYLLLREGFSRPVAAIGALAFLSFPDVVENLSAGVTDLMSVAISIWIVYFVLLALRRDTRYLRWAIFLVPLAFMTRFTGGMMLGVIVLALVYDGGRRHVVRDVLAGIAYSLVILVPYGAYYWWRFGDPLIQLWEPFVAATATTRVGMLAGQIEPSTYFLRGAPAALSATPAGWFLALLFIAGVALAIQFVAARRVRPVSAIKVVVLAVSGAVLAYLVAGPTSFAPVLLGWIVLLGILLPRWVTDRDDDRVRFLVVMAFWFVMYLAIHSHMLVKVTRYYVVMLPPLVAFLALPLETMRERLSGRDWRARAAFPLACVALVAVLGFSTYASFQRLGTLHLTDFTGYSQAKDWTDANVPESARIASDVYPPLRYRLRRMMYPAPPFTMDKPGVVEHWLDTNSIDYFMTVHMYPRLASSQLVFRSGDVSIYKRMTAAPKRPDILLIGRAVDRHLNQVIGAEGPYLHTYLNPIPDDYSSTAGTFVDEYTPAELSRYDAVLLYWFRWHDRNAAENVIRRYVSGGGTVVIDASENLGGIPWGIEDTTLLDVLVTRGSLPDGATVTVSEPALLVNGEPPAFGAFKSEEGGPWYGALYSSRFASDTRVLARIGETPIVLEQRIGRGRVIWLAGNLSFHAFLRGTASEKRFMGNLLAYADGAWSAARASTAATASAEPASATVTAASDATTSTKGP